MTARNYIRHIAFLIVLFAASQAKGQKNPDFNNFLESIKKFKNNYQIGDTILCVSNAFYVNKNFLEIEYLRKYPFLDTLEKNIQFKFKTLKEYRCSLVGQYKFQNIYLFITHSYCTDAGDGMPTLTLMTFSDKGEFADILRFSLQCISDPWTQPITKISISSTLKIFYNHSEKIYKEKVTGGFTLIKTNSTTTTYSIDNTGHFNVSENILDN